MEDGQDRHKVIRITTVVHKTTGLLVAYSDDLKGLYVHARDDDELRERLPVAIRAVLEASGHQVLDLEEIAPSSASDAGFIVMHRTFGAHLAA
jgi:hypothetical protein